MNAIAMRPAPRVPAGASSLAVAATSALSRRALLSVLTAAPAIGLMSIPAIDASPSDWPRAYAEFKAADKRWDDFMASVYNPAVDAVDAFAPTPDLTWKITARSGQTVTYRFNPNIPDEWDDWLGVIGEHGRAKKAEYLAWRERYELAKAQVGFDAIMDEDQRFCDLSVAARKAAVAASIGSIAELAEKAAFIRGTYEDSIDEEMFDVILADLRRLVTKEG